MNEYVAGWYQQYCRRMAAIARERVTVAQDAARPIFDEYFKNIEEVGFSALQDSGSELIGVYQNQIAVALSGNDLS